MSAGDVIRDFVHSNAPQFDGKSKKERQRMALGAYYSMHKKKKIKEDKMHWDDPKALEGPGKHPYATHMHKHTSGKKYELKGYVNGDVRVHDAKTGAHIGTVDQFFGSDWSTPDSMKHGMRIQSKFRREVERHINAHEKAQKQGKIDENRRERAIERDDPKYKDPKKAKERMKEWEKRWGPIKRPSKKVNEMYPFPVAGELPTMDMIKNAWKNRNIKKAQNLAGVGKEDGMDKDGPLFPTKDERKLAWTKDKERLAAMANDVKSSAKAKARGVLKNWMKKLKEEQLNEMYPFTTRDEMKLIGDALKKGPLRARTLAKNFATPKQRSKETNKKSLFPTKDEWRIGLENDKKRLGLKEEFEVLVEERKITRQAVDAFFAREKFKGKNTTVHTDKHGHTHMTLNNNRIATFMKNGSVWTNHKNWPGPTTKSRTSGIAHRLGKGSYYTKKHELHNPSGKKIGSRQWDKLKEEDEMDNVEQTPKTDAPETSGALGVLDAIVDKNALGVKTAFDDAMQNILPDAVNYAKNEIAQSMFPSEYEEPVEASDDDADLDEFIDSLSDDELEALVASAEDEDIPTEDEESDEESNN